MKTADEIYAEMKFAFLDAAGREISDDCDMAVRMYAAAAQVEALYIYNDWVKNQCFPQTASGEYLDRHAEMRGITRNSAVKAAGSIRFFIDEEQTADVNVPAGTICLTETGIYFETTENAVVEAGETYADAAAKAMKAGESGNVTTGSVIYMSPAPVGVTQCSNIAAFCGGCDAESDESLRARVLASYRALPNGANKAYYESEVLSVAGTGAVNVLPKNRGIGTVDVIVSAVDGVPSQTLLDAVEQKLEVSREICVDISVSAPTSQTVNVTCAVKAGTGYTFSSVSEAVETAIETYFDGTLLGKAVTRAELGKIIYSVEGVENYAITSPAADVVASSGVLPVLGAVSVGAWS